MLRSTNGAPRFRGNALVSGNHLSDREQFRIHIATLAGKYYSIMALSRLTVRDLKTMIQSVEGSAPDDQILIWAGKQLENDRTLAECNVKKSCTLQLFSISDILAQMGTTLVGGCMEVNASVLAPDHNFDFTNTKESGSSYRRGGELYKRPCGWKGYGLAVSGRYEDDVWLSDKPGGGGWPVSYHGTSKDCAKAIAEMGFLLSKAKRCSYGRGIYTTPDIRTAIGFSTPFYNDRRKFVVVLQNRVNPKTLRKVATPYWLSPNEDDVRPYRILIKKI
ncbi:hypothetical protein BSKO_14080 [Bryopsis sp. KO-2023]|nr:hypothetical protein BSKO_14080 [Bryopsis sp. KO-2023]